MASDFETTLQAAPYRDRTAALPRREFLTIGFDRLCQAEIVDAIVRRAAWRPFAHVVTPNVDHVLRIHADPACARAYASAWLCLNDSRVLSRLAAMAGTSLPATPGSDLVAALLADARLARTTPILVVGGPRGLGAELAGRFGFTDLVQYRPPMGLLKDAAAMAQTVEAVEAIGASLVLLAVGSPQQEILAATLAERGVARGIGLCIGAGLEFITGTKQRAPAWMRRAGLEWAHRLASEPRRLWRRYLVDGPRIVSIFLSCTVQAVRTHQELAP